MDDDEDGGERQSQQPAAPAKQRKRRGEQEAQPEYTDEKINALNPADVRTSHLIEPKPPTRSAASGDEHSGLKFLNQTAEFIKRTGINPSVSIGLGIKSKDSISGGNNRCKSTMWIPKISETHATSSLCSCDVSPILDFTAHYKKVADSPGGEKETCRLAAIIATDKASHVYTVPRASEPTCAAEWVRTARIKFECQALASRAYVTNTETIQRSYATSLERGLSALELRPYAREIEQSHIIDKRQKPEMCIDGFIAAARDGIVRVTTNATCATVGLSEAETNQTLFDQVYDRSKGVYVPADRPCTARVANECIIDEMRRVLSAITDRVSVEALLADLRGTPPTAHSCKTAHTIYRCMEGSRQTKACAMLVDWARSKGVSEPKIAALERLRQKLYTAQDEYSEQRSVSDMFSERLQSSDLPGPRKGKYVSPQIAVRADPIQPISRPPAREDALHALFPQQREPVQFVNYIEKLKDRITPASILEALQAIFGIPYDKDTNNKMTIDSSICQLAHGEPTEEQLAIVFLLYGVSTDSTIQEFDLLEFQQSPMAISESGYMDASKFPNITFGMGTDEEGHPFMDCVDKARIRIDYRKREPARERKAQRVQNAYIKPIQVDDGTIRFTSTDDTTDVPIRHCISGAFSETDRTLLVIGMAADGFLVICPNRKHELEANMAYDQIREIHFEMPPAPPMETEYARTLMLSALCIWIQRTHQYSPRSKPTKALDGVEITSTRTTLNHTCCWVYNQTDDQFFGPCMFLSAEENMCVVKFGRFRYAVPTKLVRFPTDFVAIYVQSDNFFSKFARYIVVGVKSDYTDFYVLRAPEERAGREFGPSSTGVFCAKLTKNKTDVQNIGKALFGSLWDNLSSHRIEEHSDDDDDDDAQQSGSVFNPIVIMENELQSDVVSLHRVDERRDRAHEIGKQQGRVFVMVSDNAAKHSEWNTQWAGPFYYEKDDDDMSFKHNTKLDMYTLETETLFTWDITLHGDIYTLKKHETTLVDQSGVQKTITIAADRVTIDGPQYDQQATSARNWHNQVHSTIDRQRIGALVAIDHAGRRTITGLVEVGEDLYSHRIIVIRNIKWNKTTNQLCIDGDWYCQTLGYKLLISQPNSLLVDFEQGQLYVYTPDCIGLAYTPTSDNGEPTCVSKKWEYTHEDTTPSDARRERITVNVRCCDMKMAPQSNRFKIQQCIEDIMNSMEGIQTFVTYSEHAQYAGEFDCVINYTRQDESIQLQGTVCTINIEEPAERTKSELGPEIEVYVSGSYYITRTSIGTRSEMTSIVTKSLYDKYNVRMPVVQYGAWENRTVTGWGGWFPSAFIRYVRDSGKNVAATQDDDDDFPFTDMEARPSAAVSVHSGTAPAPREESSDDDFPAVMDVGPSAAVKMHSDTAPAQREESSDGEELQKEGPHARRMSTRVIKPTAKEKARKEAFQTQKDQRSAATLQQQNLKAHMLKVVHPVNDDDALWEKLLHCLPKAGSIITKEAFGKVPLRKTIVRNQQATPSYASFFDSVKGRIGRGEKQRIAMELAKKFQDELTGQTDK